MKIPRRDFLALALGGAVVAVPPLARALPATGAAARREHRLLAAPGHARLLGEQGPPTAV